MSGAPDLKVLEAAATWYVQLNDDTCCDATSRAWQTWLHANPQHAAAWARVEKLQQQWARVPRQTALSSLSAAKAQRREVLKILSLLLAAGACSWLAVEELPYTVRCSPGNVRAAASGVRCAWTMARRCR